MLRACGLKVASFLLMALVSACLSKLETGGTQHLQVTVAPTIVQSCCPAAMFLVCNQGSMQSIQSQKPPAGSWQQYLASSFHLPQLNPESAGNEAPCPLLSPILVLSHTRNQQPQSSTCLGRMHS